MDLSLLPDNPYLLLTPGPLSVSKGVRAALFRDWCTWDEEYNALVQSIRRRVTTLALGETEVPGFTTALMQGSGTFSVEAMIGTALPEDGKLLVLANGAYGQRIARIAERLSIEVRVLDSGETNPPDIDLLRRVLAQDLRVTHVAAVHCETTTGMLNPVQEIGMLVKEFDRIFLVDAMSSLGGIPLSMDELGADFLVSSANKCVQGVPGFGFVVARQEELEQCQGRARSLSLDLYDQWREMEDKNGKWRYTSPTHVVRAFDQALIELEAEGGVPARHARYAKNQRLLVQGMRALGFATLLPDDLQSPIITAFRSPTHADYAFKPFYNALKAKGFVIYPGKVTGAETFRIGNIGHVFPEDIERLLTAVKESMALNGAT